MSTKTDEIKLMVFERKILRRNFDLKRNEDDDYYEIGTDRYLINLYNEPNIVWENSSQIISSAGHVGEQSYSYRQVEIKQIRRGHRQQVRWVVGKKYLKSLVLQNGNELASQRDTRGEGPIKKELKFSCLV